MCWTYFRTIGHCSKNLGLSEKTFRLPYFPKLVTGLREPFLKGLRVGVLCTQLYYICFIRVLDVGRWVKVGCYNAGAANRGSRAACDTLYGFMRLLCNYQKSK